MSHRVVTSDVYLTLIDNLLSFTCGSFGNLYKISPMCIVFDEFLSVELFSFRYKMKCARAIDCANLHFDRILQMAEITTQIICGDFNG